MAIIPIEPGCPTLTASKRLMACCRACNKTMFGIYDWNLRYFCDACEDNPDDEKPKKFVPKVWSPL